MRVSEEIRLLFSREAAGVLDVPYINAMLNGHDDSTNIKLTFIDNGENVLEADVTMGASSYDLRDFAVAEALYQYKKRTGEEPPQYTHIQIGPHQFEASYFTAEDRLWKESLTVRKNAGSADYLMCLWIFCGEQLVQDFQDVSGSHHEFKSAARKTYLPLHAAYLYQTCRVKLYDAQGKFIKPRSALSRSVRSLNNKFFPRKSS